VVAEITAKRQLNGTEWRAVAEITAKKQLNGMYWRAVAEITAKTARPLKSGAYLSKYESFVI